MDVWVTYFNESEDADASSANIAVYRSRYDAADAMADMLRGAGIPWTDPMLDDVKRDLALGDKGVAFDFGGDGEYGRVMGFMWRTELVGPKARIT